MKTTKIATFIAVSTLGLIPALHARAADSDHPFYIGAQGNIASPSDSDASGAAKGPVNYGFSSGASVVAGWEPEALNTDSGDVRAELEGGYHAMGLDRVIANNNPKGDLRALTVMGNVYYDVHTGTSFTPYIGAGVGQAFVHFPKGQGLGNADNSSNVLAYQAMAGVAYTPESMPQTDFTMGYKYIGFESPSFSNGAGGENKIDPLHENAIEMGVRYHF